MADKGGLIWPWPLIRLGKSLVLAAEENNDCKGANGSKNGNYFEDMNIF